MTADPAFAPIHELAGEIAADRLSPVDLVEASLARIERLDGRLHAFTEVYAREARLAAEAAERMIRAGASLGPLHGMPLVVKDLFDIEGRVAAGGSKAWAARVSPVTATVVRRLRAAGMIVLGKTHTVEFAYGGWGTNAHMGTPQNPWDMDVHRVPGGSSSGTGVAVAAGYAPAGLGTDTGGSVRLPASFCGVVGLKTTVGRVSTFGVLPLSHTLDTVGPLTRSVEDAALLFEAMQGPDHADPRTMARPIADTLPTLGHGVQGMRLGALPPLERRAIDPEVLAAYDRSLQVLSSLGAEIVEMDLDMPLTAYRDIAGTIIGAEAYAVLSETVDRDDLPLDPHVRARVRAGATVSAKDYLSALAARDRAKAAFAEAMDGLHAFLTPTTSTAAIPVAAVDEATTPADLTRLGNLLDLCGLALPDGRTAAGLPTSLLINGRGFDEATVLRIGWAYEQATDWHREVPPGL